MTNKSKIKLTRRSAVMPHHKAAIDTVMELRQNEDGVNGMNWSLLMEARNAWEAMRKLRENRERCIRYLYGDQWGDEIIGRDGCMCSEKEAIVSDGNVPLTNNLIRKLVRTVVGVYRNQNKVPSCTANDRDEQSLGDTMSVALQVNWKNNYKKELDARCFEDYLAGGAVCQKETFGWNSEKQRQDAWTYWPDINRMFWNPDASDIRTWDLTIIGEIHDVPFNALCGTFARTRSDIAKLRAIYDNCRTEKAFNEWYGKWNTDRDEYHMLSNLDFFVPMTGNLCRVIEIWRKEAKPRYHVHDTMTGEFFKCEVADARRYELENLRRVAEYAAQGIPEEDVPKIELTLFVDEYWYYRFLSPLGDILDEGETPYDHKSHPYVLKLYPLVNGEVHSFVGDVIDQQRYVNRLISLNDKLIRSAAKGVLMYPLSLIPDGKTPEDVQREWRDPDAVMFVDDLKGRMSGMKPEQYVNKLVNIGTTEMIQMQMGLLEEISGVNSALQGKPGFSGQSATLYAQQTQNSSTSILDLLESFEDLILRGAEKKVKNIQQFYDERRTMAVAGRSANVIYDPLLCGEVDFDLSISEMADSPVFRMQMNDLLMQMFQLGAINITQLLENGSWPFADRLLESLKADQQAAMEAQQQAQQGGEMMAAPTMDNTQRELTQSSDAGNADYHAVQQAQQLMRYDILSPHDAQVRVREQTNKNAGVQ